MKRPRLPPADQPSLFETTAKPKKVRGRKRIAATTLEAYRKLLPTLGRRQREVAEGLDDWIAAAETGLFPNRYPTSYELFHFLEKRGQAFDISGVRSVLTGLKDAGLVEWCGTRTCTVTGERVHVWSPAIGASHADEAAGRATEGKDVGGRPSPSSTIRGYDKIESPPWTPLELAKHNVSEWNAHYFGCMVWYRGKSDDFWSGPYQTVGEARLVAGIAVAVVHTFASAIPIKFLTPVGVAGSTLDAPPNNQSDL